MIIKMNYSIEVINIINININTNNQNYNNFIIKY